MGKLIKYEFRKQLFSKLVIGAMLLGAEVVFLAGLLFNKDSWGALGLGGIGVLGFGAMFYLSFEILTTYSKDLKTKQSYMLFLVPRNMFQVVGAKMITAVLQILGGGVLFTGLFIGDIYILSCAKGKVDEFIGIIKDFIEIFTGAEVRLEELVYLAVMVLVAWLEFTLMAMLAITLSTTLFANKKYKGVVSFLIYLGLEWILGKVAGLVVKTGFLEGEYLLVNTEAWAFIGVYMVAIIAAFFGTSLLLDKKVSV